MMQQHTFQINGLQAEVSAKKIIKSLDLTIKSSELHVIMGPNGSGKSTLANVLAGHPAYSQTSGQIMLDDQIFNKLTPDERAKQGLFLAFQHPVEVPGVKVLNFLWEAFKLRFSEEERLSLKASRITEFRDYLQLLGEELAIKPAMLMRNLNEGFSGGEKKRLEMLQLMVLQPRFAILDETDSGLDVDAVKAVARTIRRAINRYQTGMVVITHYRRILDFLHPNYVHVMVDGKIVETGGAELIDNIEKNGYEKYTKTIQDENAEEKTAKQN
ncbi:MAG: Fe-S cluster assembly ATPase SufC [Patescibacteria group bacterium]